MIILFLTAGPNKHKYKIMTKLALIKSSISLTYIRLPKN